MVKKPPHWLAKPVTPDGFRFANVHDGWSSAANEIFPLIVAEMARQQAAGKSITIAGHSMGGAVSGYLTYRLMAETQLFQPGKDHRLVTFGAPRYASGDFAKEFKVQAAKKSLRFQL